MSSETFRLKYRTEDSPHKTTNNKLHGFSRFFVWLALVVLAFFLIYEFSTIESAFSSGTVIIDDAILESDQHHYSGQGQKYEQGAEEEKKHHYNFFRSTDGRVISRVKLPKPYESKEQEGYCSPMIGCFKEIATMFKPMKPADVLTTFTIYTRDNSLTGFKIPFAQIEHYYDVNYNGNDTDSISGENGKATGSVDSSPVNGSIDTYDQSNMMTNSSTNGSTNSINDTTDQSYLIEEFPYDLSLMERSGYNENRPTRILIAGYFSNEDERWLAELKDVWLDLEDCNVIKVSWMGASRRTYWTAVANTRLVARQLSVFLHYMNLFHYIDTNKLHLIGHSLGAHIAGFVGHEYDGKVARITGLDPAGPVFVDINDSLRLDYTDAIFVDVMHTNSGDLYKGFFGITLASGHIDYWPNGGSKQPNCDMIIMKLVCSHQSSYKFLTEALRIEALISHSSSTEAKINIKRPVAFLLGDTKVDEVIGEENPSIVLAQGSVSTTNMINDEGLPLTHEIEFHRLRPRFPFQKRGLYFFKTASKLPYFSEQYLLTITTPVHIKKKMVIYIRLGETMVAEKDIDEIIMEESFIFVRPIEEDRNDDNVNSSTENSVTTQQTATTDSVEFEIYWRYRGMSQFFDSDNDLILKNVTLHDLSSGSIMTVLLGEGGYRNSDDNIVIPKRAWCQMRTRPIGTYEQVESDSTPKEI